MAQDVPNDAQSSLPLDDSRPAPTTTWFQALRSRLGLASPQTLRDTIEDALKDQDPASASFTDAERSMLMRLLRFGASRVDDIMVPRADIIAIEETETLSELLNLFEDAGVSRIPLFSDTLDDPRGMIHIKDLFRWLIGAGGLRKSDDGGSYVSTPAEPEESRSLTSLDLSKVDLSRPVSSIKIRRQVLYVPPSMPASDLLIRMQATRIHMALVVDEYGGTDGVVTIEDLVEQIVGQIEDEHDEAEDSNIVNDPKQGLIASARTPVAELEQMLKITLLTEDEVSEIDTLGGLVFSLVGRVPARGELIRHDSGVEFEVLDADPRRVNKLKVHLPRVRQTKASDGDAQAKT